MLGGAYLCYEGAEKLYEAVAGPHETLPEEASKLSSQAHEEQMVAGAIRTDFILSAEIMAISLAEVADQTFVLRALSLVAVALAITLLVYGVVALIVKMDDLGLRLAGGTSGPARTLGRGLVKGMPVVMSALSVVGTAAMLWVGGHIIVDGLETFGLDAPAHLLHDLALAAGDALSAVSGVAEWFVETLGSGLVGLLIGAALVAVMHLRPARH